MLHDILTAMFQGSKTSPTCPSEKSGIKRKILWSTGGMILTGDTKALGKKKHFVH